MHKNWMQNNEENDTQLQELWHLSKEYKSDFEPDVEKGLTALKHRIAKDKTENTDSAKVIPMRRLWLNRVAAAAMLLLGFGYLFNLWTNENPELKTLVTNSSIIEATKLPDGSTVWVNKNSRLSFPESFTGASRTVFLEGEAYFDVTKNLDKPFIVKTEAGNVSVLGTAFNVRAYPDERNIAVEVEEGKVAFEIPTLKVSKILEATDKIVYDKVKETLSPLNVLDWKDTAWKKRELTFQDKPVVDVLTYLVNNFDLQVSFNKEELKDCPLNATFVENQPTSILKTIESAFPTIEIKETSPKILKVSGTCN